MNTQDKNIIIRPFKAQDREAVATILVEGFGKKFCKLANLPLDKITSMFLDMGLVGEQQLQGQFVATSNGQILGIMQLKWHNQSRPKHKTEASLWTLCRRYGFWNIFKMTAGLTLLEESVDPGDCYIEHITVSPNARGLGIGTKLITHAEDFAAQLGSNRLTLHVVGSNEAAQKLYKRLGFTVLQTRNSRLLHWVFKESIVHFMTVNLAKKQS
ncbi:GNAT family N-acetyltransferase [Planctomycetota bacterium]|nr:GNAT family N-acetyltransferase [Planctomycetota bacterium]